ncbi:methylated-DNA--[protein]-cysteine S-methyltransferase [Roseateles oligotrophus]|uniref:Methylated-DNA--[protein]-cysteine S-methyltransferase n=1 Tax=Roseateles oligotrophus TaxID=1769250 RepID=A0ABT2YFT3_9BURK|nr:methylated-DNA--[protein]-cysteine S-methyltransferase [Roseateles oligotrophus]MCV2368899.1 methylated-DNA--[protein]-cysteine S-methyltransferase [Roseateles oligotrophus]
MLQFACFDTALGCCGIAWSEQGIKGSQLPEENAGLTRERMRVRFRAAIEGEPNAQVLRAIDAIQRLLAGDPTAQADLLDVQLDQSEVAEFNLNVHAITRQIPLGQTMTYGEIARRLGQPGAARAVGRAEGDNPFAPIVPCHRVLGSNGYSGGFSAPGGAQTKQKLLAIEAAATGQMAAEQQALF